MGLVVGGNMDPRPLFSGMHWHEYSQYKLAEVKERATRQIARVSQEGESGLAERLIGQFSLILPVLDKVAMEVVNVATTNYSSDDFVHNPAGFLFGPRKHLHTRLPFEGNAELFSVTPSRHGPLRPVGAVKSNYLDIIVAGQTIEQCRAALPTEIQKIDQYLEAMKDDVNRFNIEIVQCVRRLLENHVREKDELRSVANSLNIKISEPKPSQKHSASVDKDAPRADVPSLSHQARRMLDAEFPVPSDLMAFILDYFPDIYQRFGPDMDRKVKVNILLSSHEPRMIINALESYHRGNGNR